MRTAPREIQKHAIFDANLHEEKLDRYEAHAGPQCLNVSASKMASFHPKTIGRLTQIFQNYVRTCRLRAGAVVPTS